MSYPSDFNPKEALKKSAASYAQYVKYGLPCQKLQEYDELPAGGQTEMAAAWSGRSIWQLWAKGKLYQFFLTQWAIGKSPCGSTDLQAVIKFAARVSHLVELKSADADAIVAGLGADGGAAGVDAATAALPALFAATRKHPYDSGAVVAALQPVLEALPGAAAKCDDFFAKAEWSFNLARAVHIVSRPKTHANFAKAAKPILIGIGGFGLVELAFEDTWGTSFVLKRQNINMVLDKNHADRALLELKIASEVVSPFILDCSYAYVEGKDLILALRMLPGGDLSHYLKVAKEAAKKAAKKAELDPEKAKTGLTQEQVQFYLGSTLLGLEVLHAHGFVYRDLKDKNVLLDANGHARLCDFGLVHDLATGPAKGKVGTKGFWAPEQLDKKGTYGVSCDMWTLGVCAYHWSAATLPFHGEDEEQVNEATKAAEYDKTKPHLVSGSKAKEHKGLFRPHLLSLCEALIVVDPATRLGSGEEKSGYASLKAHPFFDGLNWNALGAGMLPPPIKVDDKTINADLPTSLKDAFGEWAKKDLPPEWEASLPGWTRTNAPIVEANAVEWLDKNPVFFEKTEGPRADALSKEAEVYHAALLQKGLWAQTIKPPPQAAGKGKKAAAKSDAGKDFPVDVKQPSKDDGGAASGGGCCEIM